VPGRSARQGFSSTMMDRFSLNSTIESTTDVLILASCVRPLNTLRAARVFCEARCGYDARSTRRSNAPRVISQKSSASHYVVFVVTIRTLRSCRRRLRAYGSRTRSRSDVLAISATVLRGTNELIPRRVDTGDRSIISFSQRS
jgi:hypothetical protein